MNRSTTPPSLGRRLSRSVARMRRGTTATETYWLAFLVGLTVLCGVLVAVWPHFWPMTLLVVPMVLAHLVLTAGIVVGAAALVLFLLSTLD